MSDFRDWTVICRTRKQRSSLAGELRRKGWSVADDECFWPSLLVRDMPEVKLRWFIGQHGRPHYHETY